MYMFFRGWLGPSVLAHVRVQTCRGCSGLRTQVRVGHGEEGALHACAEIWPHPSAREPASPDAGETGTERHPSSGALERRPGGAWLHVGLESAQAWSLGARLPAAAAGFCCAQRLNGSSQEAQPAVRLACPRPVSKRVSRREKRQRQRRR